MTAQLTGQLRQVDGRPSIHCTAGAGWVNDPVGLVHRGGRYHLFYQYVPGHVEWQPFCSWGHSSSADLVSWTEHPAALSPGAGDLGCWSGVLVDDADAPVIYYTSVGRANIQLGAIREARPLDDGWERWSKGTVVVWPPADPDLVAFRDPSVIREGDGWRMLVGAGYADGHAAVLSYTSADRRTWTYDGPVIEQSRRTSEVEGHEFVWECPHLIEVGQRHVLIVSVMIDGRTSHVEAAVGDYRDGRFTAAAWMPLTWGPGHYAASPFTDAAGNRGLMLWVREVGGAEQGWAGALSIPYLVTVDGESVVLRPHPTVKAALPDEAGLVGLDWRPETDDAFLELPAASSDGSAARLEVHGDTLRVLVSDRVVDLPRGTGPVSVLADDSVLEVCTGPAVAALALADDAAPPRQVALGSTIPWGPSASATEPASHT